MSHLGSVTPERCYQFVRLPTRTDFGVQCEDLCQLRHHLNVVDSREVLSRCPLKILATLFSSLLIACEGLDQRGNVEPIRFGGPLTDDPSQLHVNLIDIGAAEFPIGAQFRQHLSKMRLTPKRGGHRRTAGRESRHAATMAFVESVSIGNYSNVRDTPGNGHR